jgi:hypothetical protein
MAPPCFHQQVIGGGIGEFQRLIEAEFELVGIQVQGLHGVCSWRLQSRNCRI